MMKTILLSLALTSALPVTGCMTTTYLAVKQPDNACAPIELVLGDVLASSVITAVGVQQMSAPAVVFGAVALAASTAAWVGQLAACHHLH